MLFLVLSLPQWYPILKICYTNYDIIVHRAARLPHGTQTAVRTALPKRRRLFYGKKCDRRSIRRPHLSHQFHLAGVYESCKRRGAGKVYGMMHGVAGLLERRVCVLDDKLKSAMDIELLKRTPSSYLGSCRYKLPDWHTAEGEAVYQKLFEILGELDIGYFFYIGGNDSMDTIGKLADYGAHIGSDIRFMGVPKTIDNDLMVTDHTPGYGSAAKYIGVVMKEIIRDATVYGTKYVTIVEIMGRNAGC